jgi:hypothetical protein
LQERNIWQIYHSSPFTKCGSNCGGGVVVVVVVVVVVGGGGGRNSSSSSSSSSNRSMVAVVNNSRELAQFSCATTVSTRSTPRM